MPKRKQIIIDDGVSNTASFTQGSPGVWETVSCTCTLDPQHTGMTFTARVKTKRPKKRKP